MKIHPIIRPKTKLTSDDAKMQKLNLCVTRTLRTQNNIMHNHNFVLWKSRKFWNH